MHSQTQPSNPHLLEIQEGLNRLKDILFERFTNDNSTIHTNHSEIRAYFLHLCRTIYNFTIKTPKPTTRDKVEVNKFVRENIQAFIINYIAPKLTPIDKLAKDPHKFVSALN